MTVEAGKPDRLQGPDDQYRQNISASLGISDLAPALLLSVVVLLVGLFVNLGAHEAVSIFETTAAKLVTMILSAGLAVMALFYTLRSARRTAERGLMRAQSYELLYRIDGIEAQIKQKINEQN